MDHLLASSHHMGYSIPQDQKELGNKKTSAILFALFLILSVTIFLCIKHSKGACYVERPLMTFDTVQATRTLDTKKNLSLVFQEHFYFSFEISTPSHAILYFLMPAWRQYRKHITTSSWRWKQNSIVCSRLAIFRERCKSHTYCKESGIWKRSPLLATMKEFSNRRWSCNSNKNSCFVTAKLLERLL